MLAPMVVRRKRGKVEGEKRRGRTTGPSDDEGLRRLAFAFGLRKE